jgi:hypothetical protein
MLTYGCECLILDARRGCAATNMPGFAQRVERGHASALERGVVDRLKRVRDRDHRVLTGDRHLGVATVEIDSRDRLIEAIDEIAALARGAFTAASGEKADADALPKFPSRDTRAQCVNATDGLVARSRGDAGPNDSL